MFEAGHAIEHHQRVIKEINEMTKKDFEASLPKLRDICVCKISSDGTNFYDFSHIHGEILLTVRCSDGLAIVYWIGE